MRSLLLVTRNFAPTSHVSVERATKLAKYLPEFGWRPTVLTGATASAGLPRDEQLLEQVATSSCSARDRPSSPCSIGARATAVTAGRPGGGLRDAAPLHPKAWLVPDSQVLWYPFAVRAALRQARRTLGRRRGHVLPADRAPRRAHRSRAPRIPYVTDFRDSWTGYHLAPRRPAPLASLERWLEARIVAGAAAVVAVDQHMVQHVFARIAPAPGHRCTSSRTATTRTISADDAAAGAAAVLDRSRRPAAPVAPAAVGGVVARASGSGRSCAGRCTSGKSASWTVAPWPSWRRRPTESRCIWSRRWPSAKRSATCWEPTCSCWKSSDRSCPRRRCSISEPAARSSLSSTPVASSATCSTPSRGRTWWLATSRTGWGRSSRAWPRRLEVSQPRRTPPSRSSLAGRSLAAMPRCSTSRARCVRRPDASVPAGAERIAVYAGSRRER